ncbi:MAG: TadE/TadG family type IV pilus assembly protein [Nitrospirales bacterium]
MHNVRRKIDRENHQRGSILVEFSLVAVSISLLIALVVDVARMVFVAQVLQETARVAARELSLLPLSPVMTFEEALQHPLAKSRIFDPAALVIDLDHFPDMQSLEEFLDGLPLVNRMLRPLMIFERVMVNGSSRKVLRFPGTLLLNNNQQAPDELSVGIPHSGISGLKKDKTPHRWKSVVEEIRGNPRDPHSGVFSLQATHPDQPSGLVALRINYPFQPMFMNWLPKTVPADPVLDDSHDQSDAYRPPLNGEVFPPTSSSQIYAPIPAVRSIVTGTFKEYQRVLFGQAVYRREVFQ